jgi:AcrR family transcriptional regulator
VRRNPVQERSNDTVQQILAATSVLLEQKPSQELTTSRIAVEAGISIGGLYRFFPDKQAILDAIAVRAMEEFQSGLERELSESFPEDGAALLDLVIDAYVRFLDARPDFRSIALGQHISPSTRRRQVQPDIGPSGLIKDFMMNLVGVTETAELDVRLRIASEAGERLIAYAYEQNPEDRKIVVREMKRLLAGYLFG